MPERRQWSHSGVFIVNFEHISHPFLMLLLLTLNRLAVSWSVHDAGNIPANIYLFKVNNINSTKCCETCLKLTIKTPERRHLHFFQGLWNGNIGLFTILEKKWRVALFGTIWYNLKNVRNTYGGVLLLLKL